MDFRTALIEETKSFGDVIRGADPSTPVPTCPGWTVNQLLKHVGRGDRWCAQIIAHRLLHRLDPRDVHDGRPPDDIEGALAWLNGGVQAIFDAVDHVGPETRVWTFISPKPAGWWIRRRLHETVVHRADAVLATGGEFTVAPELAADGISEWITINAAQADPHAPPLARGMSLHLHATDDGLGPTGEWTITNDEDGLNWSHDHTKGEVAVRGSATNLLLAVTRRKTSTEAGLEVFGDAAVWDGWLSRTPF